MPERQVDVVCERVRASGALEQSARTAYGYVEQAQEAIGSLGGSLDIEPLKLIAEMAANRSV
jgi:geranylgeranyl pyrophosphate synthase